MIIGELYSLLKDLHPHEAQHLREERYRMQKHLNARRFKTKRLQDYQELQYNVKPFEAEVEQLK